MQYRTLGDTELEVSCIGLGCAQLGNSTTEYAVRLVQRALELGINYFDAARGYWDAEVKLGLALSGQRERAILSTKTSAKARDEAWQHIHGSLERLKTDYLDNCHLHGLREGEDLPLASCLCGPSHIHLDAVLAKLLLRLAEHDAFA